MAKVIEIFFRNKWKLAALLLAPVMLSGIIVFFLPRTYESTARLWALRRYEILGATGPESDLQSTPSMTQATALTELLQTRSFDLAIARDTDLPKHIGVPMSDSQRLQDALFDEISGHVSVTASGANLLIVSYSNTNPQVAAQVVKAVVAHYGKESAAHATAEGKQLLAVYQGQLKEAQNEAENTARAAAQYMQQHNLDAASAMADPQYQMLNVEAQQANTTVSNIQADINTINKQLATLSTGSDGLYQTIDPPTVPIKPESRAKTLLLGGAIGLGIGLLAAIGYLLVLVRLDESIYSVADLPESSGYPVLIQIPQLPRRSAPWITHNDEVLLPDKEA